MNQRLVPSEVIGTILVGAAQPFFQCTPPLLSANWFGADERALSTAVAINFNQVGIATAFLVGGAMAQSQAGLGQYFDVITLASFVVAIGALACGASSASADAVSSAADAASPAADAVSSAAGGVASSAVGGASASTSAARRATRARVQRCDGTSALLHASSVMHAALEEARIVALRGATCRQEAAQASLSSAFVAIKEVEPTAGVASSRAAPCHSPAPL